MKWLKNLYQENPAAFMLGVSALLTGTASVVLLKKNTKLQTALADSAKNALSSCVDAFNEGYEVAVMEVEQIAENKELQKALKQAAKA
jgi:hypothetical protein